MIVPACTTTSSSQALTAASDIADLAVSGLQAYAASKSGTLTPAQASQTIVQASNDLNGVATVAQAYLGKTPAQANIAQGGGFSVGCNFAHFISSNCFVSSTICACSASFFRWFSGLSASATMACTSG